VNWTHNDPVVRSTIDVGVAYGTDVVKARSVLFEIVTNHPDVKSDPLPRVWFWAFGDSSLTLRTFVFTSFELRIATVNALNLEIHRRFAQEGIEIAFPQRDLHLRSVPDPTSPLPAVPEETPPSPPPIPGSGERKRRELEPERREHRVGHRPGRVHDAPGHLAGAPDDSAYRGAHRLRRVTLEQVPDRLDLALDGPADAAHHAADDLADRLHAGHGERAHLLGDLPDEASERPEEVSRQTGGTTLDQILGLRGTPVERVRHRRREAALEELEHPLPDPSEHVQGEPHELLRVEAPWQLDVVGIAFRSHPTTPDFS
jgi:hypothetical protein